MATQIQIRRGTAAQWAAEEPILADGEPGFEIDTGVIKIGNGIDVWEALIPIRSRSVPMFPPVGIVGGTDATAEIQAAIEEANDAGGGVVPIYASENGLPYLFTTLRLRANVTLMGAGGTLKFSDDVCVNAAQAYYLIHNIDEGGSLAPNVSLIDLVIDGNKSENTTYLVADVITIGGENVVVSGCTITNPPDSGIMFSKATNSLCVNNRIDGARDLGIYVNDGDGTYLSENVIIGNRISGCEYGGIGLKRISSRCIVALNTIYNCGNGITLEHASSSTDYSTNLTIVNNRLRYIGYINAAAAKVGINLRGSDHVICEGNRLEDVEGNGIFVEGCRYGTVRGNVISFVLGTALAASCGIKLSERAGLHGCKSMLVDGNLITNAPSHGIYLAGSSGAANSREIVAHNIVVAAGGSALRIEAMHDDVQVNQNSLDGALDAEIYAGASGIRTTGNHLVNNQASASWSDVCSQDGKIFIGNVDTYFTRLAADIATAPQLRSRSSIAAFYAGDYHVLIGNLGKGAGAGGISAAPAGSSATDVKLWRAGVGLWRTDSSLRFETGVGPILTSPNGTLYKLLVSDAGVLSTVAV